MLSSLATRMTKITRKAVWKFQGHAKTVSSVAFSPNGEYVLTGSWDDTAKLWNLKNGTLVHTFQGHTKFVNSVAFSPNGEYVLTGSYDRTAKLWNLKNRTLVHTFEGHTATRMTKITRKPVWKFQGHAKTVSSVVFSPNGEYVLTGSYDKTAK